MELLSAVAIIGVLAALMLPRYHAYKVRARRGEAKVNLGQISSLQSIYQVEHYKFKALPLAGYKGTCDTSDGTPLAALGFTPDDCDSMRYGYEIMAGAKSFTATAFGPSDADGRWIYPCCDGAGASECGESSGDKLRVTNKERAHTCRDITKYCDKVTCVGGGGGGGPPPPPPPCTTCSLNSYSYGAWSSWSPALTCPGPDITQTRSRTVTKTFTPCRPTLACPDETTTQTETRTEICPTVPCNPCTETVNTPTYTSWAQSDPTIDTSKVCNTDTYEEFRERTETTTYTAAATNSCACPSDSDLTTKETRDVTGPDPCPLCSDKTDCCNHKGSIVLKSSLTCDAAYDLDISDCSCKPKLCAKTCDTDETLDVDACKCVSCNNACVAGTTKLDKALCDTLPCVPKPALPAGKTLADYCPSKSFYCEKACENIITQSMPANPCHGLKCPSPSRIPNPQASTLYGTKTTGCGGCTPTAWGECTDIGGSICEQTRTLADCSTDKRTCACPVKHECILEKTTHTDCGNWKTPLPDPLAICKNDSEQKHGTREKTEHYIAPATAPDLECKNITTEEACSELVHGEMDCGEADPIEYPCNCEVGGAKPQCYDSRTTGDEGNVEGSATCSCPKIVVTDKDKDGNIADSEIASQGNRQCNSNKTKITGPTVDCPINQSSLAHSEHSGLGDMTAHNLYEHAHSPPEGNNIASIHEHTLGTFSYGMTSIKSPYCIWVNGFYCLCRGALTQTR